MCRKRERREREIKGSALKRQEKGYIFFFYFFRVQIRPKGFHCPLLSKRSRKPFLNVASFIQAFLKYKLDCLSNLCAFPLGRLLSKLTIFWVKTIEISRRRGGRIV